MRWVLVLALAGLLAAASAMSAFAAAGASRTPALAASAFSLNGAARANLAKRDFASAQNQRDGLTLEPPASTVALAMDAYVREPLSPDMLALIATGPAQKDTDALAILEAGHAMSRQSTVLNYALIEALARRGETQASLRLFDEMLRRHTPFQGVMMERLSLVAANPRIHPYLLQLLADRPAWDDQFWRQLAQTPPSIPHAGPLRLGYARQGGTVDPEVDRLLVDAIVSQGLFDEGRRVACGVAVGAQPAVCVGGRVENGEFARSPKQWPFDWRLTSTGDFGATVDTKRQRLIISALDGARGIAAEQLVYLPERSVQLIVDAGQTGSTKPSGANVRVVCARDKRVLFERPLRQLRARFESAGCKYAHVQVALAVPTGGGEIEAAVSRIELST